MTGRAGRRIAAAEWVTLAISALIVGALIAVALVEERRRQSTEGVGVQSTFGGDRAEFRDGAYYVPYTVRNTGAEAIVSAEIWIDVYDGERLVESDEIAVELLPLQGTQEGVYATMHDPAEHRFVGRLESLQIP